MCLVHGWLKHDEAQVTPLQARIAFAGFALVAAAVTYNALYRQDASQAEAAATRETSQVKAPAAGKIRAETPAPNSKSPSDPAKRSSLAPAKSPEIAATTEAASADTIKAIQRELKGRGYGPLEADGAAGPATRAAIVSFEEANHLPPTGRPTEELLKHLVLGVPPLAAGGKSEVRATHADARVR
jgi:peptidoglycan hydrolase-like protein with peptidoglycan-binding domain